MPFIFLLFLSVQARAELCEVKEIKTGAVLHSYDGPCAPSKFGGLWGDISKVVHAPNPAREGQERAEQEQKRASAEAIYQNLKAKCGTASDQTIKAICDFLLAPPETPNLRGK